MDIKLPDFAGLVAEVATEVHDRVKRRTPVDTGRAQANWQLSIRELDASVSNDTDYIGYLEEGTSTISPVGMIRTTLEEIPDIIDDFIRKDKR